MTTEQIIQLVITAVTTLIHIVSVILCSKGVHVLCKHDTNNQEEVQTLQPRKADYRETLTAGKKTAEAPKYSRYVKQYRLNAITDTLEEDEPLDIVAFIESSVDTCLSQQLARLLPEDDPNSSEVLLDNVRDDVDFLNEAFGVADEWREKLNLPADVDTAVVFDKMREYSEVLQKSIKEVQDRAQAQKQNASDVPPETPQDVEKSE